MPADPIRDALREAGEAICKRWSDGDDEECRAAHHADAAAAVAAFHRHMAAAMPDTFIYNRIVAIAVERAAKGEA